MKKTVKTCTLELLAPAGNRASLMAALEGGADAVYFGLKNLNARRGAENFSQDDLQNVVSLVHEFKARAFLTLNINLVQREIGQAARALELAKFCGVDAVLIRDPAYLALLPHYQGLDFHFSTQAGICNSSGVKAALALGVKRVVLAREMSLREIRAASGIEGMETEVFVQGALCFSVSGQCLLSSWGGGRSGNRGACTSPCRVDWQVCGIGKESYLSMLDFSLLKHLPELSAAGVASIKIEGRLKNADWVSRAVKSYAEVLAGSDPVSLQAEVDKLGTYSGRKQTDAYLFGKRDSLTGRSGRETNADVEEKMSCPKTESKKYNLEIKLMANQLQCSLNSADKEMEWTEKLSKVVNAERALSLADFATWLRGISVQGYLLDVFICDTDSQLLGRKTANRIVKKISALLHRCHKKPDTTIRIELPAKVKCLTVMKKSSPANRLHLGQRCNRVRLEAGQVHNFIKNTQVNNLVITRARAGELAKLKKKAGGRKITVSLPAVIYEGEIKEIEKIIAVCRQLELLVEVNSYSGWHLAKSGKVQISAGQGLAVLNSLAAWQLAQMGAILVSYSLEADKGQLELLSSACQSPAVLTVFGRPALLTTRAETGWGKDKNIILEDSRKNRLKVCRNGTTTVFYPENAFAISQYFNRKIRAAFLEADLVYSDDPVTEWYNLGNKKTKLSPFNYKRGLY